MVCIDPEQIDSQIFSGPTNLRTAGDSSQKFIKFNIERYGGNFDRSVADFDITYSRECHDGVS